MNFLSLCQELRSESGIQGTGPTTVVGQTGFHLQIVNWINKAYRDVQNLHPNWFFMTKDFSFPTIATQREYQNGSGVGKTGLTDLKDWNVTEAGDIRCYLTSAGVSNEQYMEYIPWAQYRQAYLYGSRRTQTDRPRFFSIQPNQGLNFYPVPDDVYTIIGEYFQKPDQMTLDADVPNFPEDFHEILVWRGLMLYGAFDAANERYSHGKNEFGRLKRALELNQLPKFQYGAPLA